MQYYSLKLRLGGSTMNEVRGVYSAPEILVLQYIHGVDSITDLKRVREERLNMREYKEKLKAMYDMALVKRGQSIDGIFGALGQLPTKLPDDLLEMHDIVDEDDVVAVARNITKKDKNAQSAHLPRSDVEARRLEQFVPQSEINLDELVM